MRNPEIAAFYQCYKQPKSVIATLESFRKFYPEATIFLISDGGYDYATLARHFNCIYVYNKRIGQDLGIISKKIDGILSWLDRLIDAAGKIKEEYIMILEDDVRVFSKVSEINYDLNGINTEVKIGRELTNFLKEGGAQIPSSCKNYYFGGCGGSIIKKDFLLKNFKNLDNATKELIPFLDEEHKSSYVSDYWLSVLFLYFGGRIGQYKGFCEKWYLTYLLRKRILKNISVLHFDKSFNNQRLNEEEINILGGIEWKEYLLDYNKHIDSVESNTKNRKKVSSFVRRFISLIKRKTRSLLMQKYATL